MADPVRIELTNKPIDPKDLAESVQHPGCGATVTFLGTVRNEHHGRPVLRLDYSAYAGMAEGEMRKIAEEVCRRWPVERVTLLHRVGTLEIGEASIGIALSLPHRLEGFEALRYAIDTFKETVPIWKREHFADGEAVWVEGS